MNKSMNRKGWIRIAESVFAIMLIASVALVLYSKNSQRPDLSEQIYELQKNALNDFAANDRLREAILINDFQVLNDSAYHKIPKNFFYELRICGITEACAMNSNVFDRDVYVEERIISATFQSYSPKKVRLFIWEA